MHGTPENPEERLVSLIAAHQPAIHRYILSLLPDRMLADDIAQETNLVLWRKAAEYDPAQPFLPWALTIAWFQVKAARRDAAPDRHVFDDDLVETLATENRELATGGSALADALDHCLARLPRKQRRLILDRYQPGTSVKDLAAAASKSPTAVSLALLRIRKALELCIERRLNPTPS